MRHFIALVLKFGLTTLILWIVLGALYDVPFTDVFLISTFLTLLGYLGDVFLLPRVGNVIAAIGDFGLALITVWFMGIYRFDADVSLMGASFASAAMIALGEWFFHKYMKNTLLDREAIRSSS
ncbi:uncharacterized protein DUF2512 [Melghirimyces profundicolus]|uniref:Uncharacterized protein DUF2512 n=1 Tax=Melghirimyces profundicolus TaxID=1242148 RepID=A0A2T6AY18_9BACL|nr:YndM family protein [Melghirimyces profundicolus]PTX48711.1 uncharacterized protein DUF2512 [Melghirimyces profundicolus]